MPILLVLLAFLHLNNGLLNAQNIQRSSPKSTPPKLPMNIPPPPSFASLSNKSGKYQLVSAEYYSQDPKPYLYKRLIKFDTSTGEALDTPFQNRQQWRKKNLDSLADKQLKLISLHIYRKI